MNDVDPVALIVVIACVAIMPLAIMLTTSFLKISVVLALLRNAIGVQQVPPNMALNGLALILSLYVMAPVLGKVAEEVKHTYEAGTAPEPGAQRFDTLMKAIERGAAPLKAFMTKHSSPGQRQFFMDTAVSLWGPQEASGLREDNLLVLIPAFVVSQLTAAFQVGFLLYLPFIIIDLIVSNVLLAMGMMMVSPVTIAIPLKLFLFVMLDGWTKLIQGLVLSYS
ncbi:type III secretion system export apparatus subunit SctR [Bordetella bronchialis]|uniref:EscR/YscR/HrcR family type III secretion system export apparatus protein n=1 Tax=Bordetella bronchialis TaxID=463025 RepID=A0A193FR87_9BORD|nr:type III secretion system export apparatus subunit SctR [Bordetella bronchialis]ANN69803.1 EscR/YscR/HrcR family type III secretion system export apparatus protein [Bordetella bronchialis]ANN74953.1 EscR/YscR/HrcR family type III secretion system export apparatus protein [Bordetella bronchialis]